MAEPNTSFRQLIWVVTFKLNSDEQQQDKIFFTKRAADDYALTVELMGGIAVVTEELENGTNF